ncbi:BrnA antitoxin family protein [Mesorhizobium sp. CN2-181]|uniref:BrnA antitoxin family protein n=1 Tax=Mesorhizobium yinganensis TaxID=3157707 RepID=UPI0032B86503
MTDEEDAQIRAAAESDPDAPPVEEILRRKAGRPPLAQTKRSVHLRLDEDVVRYFEAGGRGWQTRVNAALRKAAGL